MQDKRRKISYGNMKILVTGGAGFIGSHITDLLIRQGHEVAVIDDLSKGNIKNVNPKAKFYHTNILSGEVEKIFEEERFSVVFHEAAKTNLRKSIKEPLLYEKDNVLGTINILECCRKFNVKRIIYAASASRYGNPIKLPCDESHPIRAASPYALSKHVAEKYIQLYSNLYGIKYTFLVYSNVYGPRQDSSEESGAISVFINKLLRNQSPIIFGSGKQTRDFTYVRDIALANLLVLNNKKADNKTLNICCEKETSIMGLYNKIAHLLGKDIKPLFKPAIKGEIERIYLSNALIEKELNWKPSTSLDDGLRETIEYYKRAMTN